jgi:hypothetical protein
LSLRLLRVITSAYALPTRSRRRRGRLNAELHRIEVERKALTSRILLKRADRLNVERPRRPALINDQLAVEFRNDWRFDRATRLTYLTLDATQRVRTSIRAAIKRKFDLRRFVRKSVVSVHHEVPAARSTI